MLTLRPYQSDTINNTRKAFRDGCSRPLVVLPCGGGKTACFAYMAQQSQSKNNTVWFLVHRQELQQQTLDTFARFNIPLDTIHIGMVATVARRLDKYPAPNIIIFDEGHHATANTWKTITGAFPNTYVVGLTATPCRLDGKPLGDVYDSLITGITTRELIDQGYLSRYKYFAPSVADLTSLGRRGRDYDTEQAEKLLMERAVYGDVINHYREFANGLQTICYCTTTKHSEEMAQAFRDEGIQAVHFDGNTPDKERKAIIKSFRDGVIKILCNCDLISEGFDCPDCHCCMLLRPTLSTSLFIQQSCRALRPQPGKTAIIIDAVGNYARHGLPDDDREWSLNSALPARNDYGADGKLAVKQCTKCFFTYQSAPACPNCGHINQLTRQEIKNIKDIKLAEVKQGRRDKAKIAVRDITSIAECRSLAEIMAWCQANNKSTGYGYYEAKRRGWLR